VATKTKTVNIYEAKTQLSKLVDEAAAGGEIIIAKAGKAKARLMPLEKARKGRRPGGWEGRLWIAEDFDDDLPSDVLSGFVSPSDDTE
jgi:prevent-host-death family protein